MFDTASIFEIKVDCQILLDRAFKKKYLAAYGIDGYGLYGKSDQGQFLYCDRVDVSVIPMNFGSSTPDLLVALMFAYPFDQLGFSPDGLGENGYVVTDKNLELSINQELRKQAIDTTFWKWAPLSMQPRHGVFLACSVKKLLNW